MGTQFEQFANSVAFPHLAGVPSYTADDYLRELRAFLADYPAHQASPDAAEAIARTLDQSGPSDKPDQIIAAYTDFIEAKNYTFDPNAEVNRTADKATGLTPAESLLRRQQAAMFRIGQIHYAARRYAESIAQWQKYIAAHPNGKEWQQAQSGIVNAEFQSGLTAVSTGDEKKAREIFDSFLARYPLDARARQILFIYGQFHYAAGLALKGQPTDKTQPHFQNAITEWARLIGKYPNTEESSLALYNTALILSDELGRLEDGLAAFKRVTWGNWAGPAKQRVQLMSSKSLAVASERVFRLNEIPAVKVSLRNIEKLKVSRYPLDVEGFFRSRHRMDAIDLLDIDLISPDKTWEVAVKDFSRFRSIQQEIPVEFPEGKSGAYVVRVEADDWQATTLLVRSDIDVLVESARREVLTYVHSADKKPVANATVLLSDGEKIIATGVTGADGVFRAKPEGIEKAGTVRAFVSTPQGMAGSFLELAGIALSNAPEKMARVFFDRRSYRAGDTVHWQAIRRDVKDGTFPVSEPGDGWKWRAQLPDGRLMYEGQIKWDALGLCSGSFLLPPSAFEGDYKVRVFLNDTNSVQGNFTVAEQDDQGRGFISHTMPFAHYFVRGETIKGTFTARWANGLPVSNELTYLTLPDGIRTEIKTDANGSLSYEFAASKVRVGNYSISLEVPVLNQNTTLPVHVVEQDTRIGFAKLPEVVLAGEAFELKATSSNHHGDNVATALKLTIRRREAAKPSRVLEGVPWISGFTNPPADTPVSEVEIKTGDNGEAVQPVTMPQPGTYILKLSGKDKAGKEITAENTLRAAGGDDDSNLRLLAPDAPLITGQTLKLRVMSGFAHPNALVTVHAQEFFSHQLVALQAGSNTLEIPVIAAHAPNFRITVAAMDGRNVHIASRPFEVRSGLKVTLTAEVDGYTVKTTDLAGNPVAARVLTSTWSPADGVPFQPEPKIVIPTRATGLSIESSAVFAHTGSSPQKQGDQFVGALNDVMALNNIQLSEIRINSLNTVLLTENRILQTGNAFLARTDTGRHGVFVINSGLNSLKRDALGIDVNIHKQGVPDIHRTEKTSVAQASQPVWPAGIRPAAPTSQRLDTIVDTDATGVKKIGGLAGPDAKGIAVYAVDGTSLVAVDTLHIPAKADAAPVLPKPASLPATTTASPVGGLFTQGEHTLALPGDETITQDAEGKPLPAPIVKKAIGYRLIKAPDLASFPGASLNAAGEIADASEPQNAASDLLHVLSAHAGAKEEAKAALRARLDLITAELAVTESEGGWAWENLSISPGLLTTAFTWRTLLEAKKEGVIVSEMMLKRTSAFVAGRYAGIGATDFERKATTLQALAAAGKADFSLLNALFRTRETLTPVALSRLCTAFIHAGREDEAKEVLTQLLKTGTAGKAATGEAMLYWPGSKNVAGLNAPEESTAAAPVANGESKDRDFARYVTAQVYHAQGQPAQAIEWYQKVKTVYEDAAEAIAWFEDKKVQIPEVSIFKPNEPVKLTLDYRNIKEGAVQLYKVDLMKLYLREKSLSNITKINLAGIAPQASEAFALGEGKDYDVKKKELTLPVKDEGAYLAIVRGDNLFTSGLVPISPLKLEVKENQAGSVRVNVTDAASGKALADAEVKALGSNSKEVQSGSTGPRGVFEAGDISGTSTVIVKQGENRYAFHRGIMPIGFAPPSIPQTFGNDAAPADPFASGAESQRRRVTLPQSGKPKVLGKEQYFQNLDESNKKLQKEQIDNWDVKRRSNAKGVQAGESLKK